MKFSDPFKILSPHERWAPTQSQMDAFQNAYEKLLPPLVYKIRLAVAKWRDENYAGASDTTKSLLNFWFNQEHLIGQTKFSFFFSQREAIESIVYLYEIANAKDKYELMKFDSSGRISTGMFDENWTRYVVKMATGAGKTKVMGLTLVWSYFHKLYEADSTLSKDFLVIAPNIIVLNRLRKDFDGLKMFFDEPFIPDNGFDDKDWKNDFQLTLHIQDDLKPITESGNIFLTNIHRVFFNEEPEQSFETTFLGVKPKPDADTSKGLDLGKILRSDKIKNLVVLNDEAHHIHDSSLAWFKSIEDINNKLKLKTGNGISLQADYTATPRHNNGAIFVQTICDYPLVEAIKHNVVKSPVLPDEASRQKIQEKDSNDFVERYRDYIHLGYLEWEQQYEELKNHKTPILFIMTMNTKEADQAAAFLEANYPKMKNSVLTIHTNTSGEIKESASSKKDKEELEQLRKAADDIDKDHSPYKAVVSVLMLREGWDVRNVTTIVGLRPYGADSKILPEQTIGRGLRKMFSLDIPEKLVIVGTPKFLEFVEELKTEGVEFQYSPMGKGAKGKSPVIVEVDKENPDKDLDKLDIPIPQLSPRIYREFKNLELIDVSEFKNEKVALKKFSSDELKEIVFNDIEGNLSHKTVFKDTVPDYRNVIGFFTASILKDSRLVSGFNILYPKVESFIKYHLFTNEVDLSDPQTLRNLSEVKPKEVLRTTFKKAIDELTVTDKGTAEVKNYISLKLTKPKVAENQPFLVSKKSVFNKIIGDNPFELEVASFLESRFSDVIAYAKNTMGEGGINFKIEYQAQDGNIREYYPDFFVKTGPNTFYILETKGREDLDDLLKIKRLVTWCKDVNNAQSEYTYTPVYVKQEKWDEVKQNLKSFQDLIEIFKVSEL
ncbi:DEAD/DEAH box helicase [Schleiferia thermophila]|uniref:Type III restriction enzyme n=2 Tax=Schleiferia thermophila TaxID=884107 RepID=A0A369A809_9FLAO|nr:DEAD/DEAH box helicase family protein [Schleiferia thermophila]RCX05502.1 type III restriction enzyme [Schleiferia thermophila]GCD79002.1 type III restriction protein res subunit [Schleiferia thermophila]